MTDLTDAELDRWETALSNRVWLSSYDYHEELLRLIAEVRRWRALAADDWEEHRAFLVRMAPVGSSEGADGPEGHERE